MYSEYKTNNMSQWITILVFIIIIVVVIWIFSKTGSNSKSILSRFTNKKNKKNNDSTELNKDNIINYLKKNSKEKINEKENNKQMYGAKARVQNAVNNVAATFTNAVANVTAAVNPNDSKFKANVLAGHNLLLDYVNTLNNYADEIYNDLSELGVKVSKKKYNTLKDHVTNVTDNLNEIKVKLGEFNNVPGENIKLNKKYRNYLSNKLKCTYSKLDQVQYDLLKLFEDLYNFSSQNNLNQEEYIDLINPALNVLKYVYDTHQSLNNPSDIELQLEYESLLNELSKKRNKAAMSRIEPNEKFYQKLHKNFYNWFKVNVQNA